MKKVYSVKIGSNHNSETTKEELMALGVKRGVVVEFQPSRRFDGEIMRINGQSVAYNFNNKADAVMYAGALA